jgi:hypothetical protein
VLVWSRRWIQLTFRTFVSRFRLEAIYGNGKVIWFFR